VSISGNQKGGGYGSRQHVETRVRTGSGSRGTRPAGVGQIGALQGDHVTAFGGSQTPYRGERLHNDRNFQPVPFGNEVALNVGKGGPGTGRTIYKTGTQCQTGTNPGNPRPNSYRDAFKQE
jgi:hypothetical protein